MTADPTHPRAQRLICVVLPRFNMMSLMSLLEPVRIANYLSPAPLYAPLICAAEAGGVTASNGMAQPCAPLPDKVDRADLVLVIGSWGAEHCRDAGLIGWLRRADRAGARLCAVEMAGYVLARAGLLDGRQATVHWSYLPGFQELFAKVRASDRLYTQDGRILTCAGSTAGVDMMLGLMRADHGDALAAEVADNMLHHPVRAGDDPQRKRLGRGFEGLPAPVASTIALMDAHIAEPLSVPELARQAGVSQRQLERQFNRAIGCSVVQFGRLMRLQHARVLLISTDLSVREIATASGFNSLSHFAYAFRSCFGRRPSAYRQAWPDQAETPSWPGTLSKYLDTLRMGQTERH